MYQINIESLVRNKLYICKDFHIQPSEIDRMWYFEYEQILKEINAHIKEQEKQNEEQQKQYDNLQKNMNPRSMMNSMKMPSMPKMPTISMPKI